MLLYIVSSTVCSVFFNFFPPPWAGSSLCVYAMPKVPSQEETVLGNYNLIYQLYNNHTIQSQDGNRAVFIHNIIWIISCGFH